jgi:hypothetical protein
MNLAQADRQKLLPLLDQLARAVEDLLLTGLTTASEATRQTLHVAFQEASRMRLLRLGGTLRVANEELGRFTRNETQFSAKRLLFFLNRAWLLSKGLARALREHDEAEFDRLLWTPANEPVERLEVVTLGVSKKVATGAFNAFEFRLRTVADAGSIPAGRRLMWSVIFPVKPGMDLPPEAFLLLPQKQKFSPNVFLEGRVLVIEKAAVALDEFGGGRISLGDQSTVTPGDKFTDWERYQTWDPGAALRRIQGHQTGPFDLEVEMQEEVVLDGWEMGEPAGRPDGQTVYPVEWQRIHLDALVGAGIEGQALKKSLDGLRKKKGKPPLFGLMHYERCRLVLQPLAVFTDTGPEQLGLSAEKVDRAALLKALKWT